MQTKKCPNCGLLNPENAGRCDCGFDFETKTIEESLLSKSEWDQKFTPKYKDLALIGAISAVVFTPIGFCIISGLVVNLDKVGIDTIKYPLEKFFWLIPISPLVILFSPFIGGTISIVVAQLIHIRWVKLLPMITLLTGAVVGILAALGTILIVLGMQH